MPSHYGALAGRGDSLLKLGSTCRDEAIGAFKAALELYPFAVTLPTELITLMLEKEKERKQEEDAAKAPWVSTKLDGSADKESLVNRQENNEDLQHRK